MQDSMDLKRLYGRWAEPIAEPIPGYTILLAVPADLPVFAELALRYCAHQDPAHLVETLVVPDVPTPAFSKRLDAWAADYTVSPVLQVRLRPSDLRVAHRGPILVRHWLQWVRGIEATRTTHALMHDVDLFFADPSLLRTQFEACLQRNLVCLGTGKAWEPWYEEHGITHLAATSDLLFRVDWARSFVPTEHLAHPEVVAGEPHYFDTTLWTQYRTPPHLIGRYPPGSGFVHFGYVVGQYREFQHSEGPFEDRHYRLLLIRLLVDACDQTGCACDVPPPAELAKGIADGSRRVTYCSPATRYSYQHWRGKLQQLVDGGLLSDEQVSSIKEGVRAFDRALDAQ